MGGRGSTSSLSAGRNLGSTNGSGYKSVSEGLRSGALIKDRGTGEIVPNKGKHNILYDENSGRSYRIDKVEYRMQGGGQKIPFATAYFLANGKWFPIKGNSVAATRLAREWEKKKKK